MSRTILIGSLIGAAWQPMPASSQRRRGRCRLASRLQFQADAGDGEMGFAVIPLVMVTK
jgi:hypothetical protein